MRHDVARFDFDARAFEPFAGLDAGRAPGILKEKIFHSENSFFRNPIDGRPDAWVCRRRFVRNAGTAFLQK